MRGRHLLSHSLVVTDRSVTSIPDRLSLCQGASCRDNSMDFVVHSCFVADGPADTGEKAARVAATWTPLTCAGVRLAVIARLASPPEPHSLIQTSHSAHFPHSSRSFTLRNLAARLVRLSQSLGFRMGNVLVVLSE